MSALIGIGRTLLEHPELVEGAIRLARYLGGESVNVDDIKLPAADRVEMVEAHRLAAVKRNRNLRP